MGKRSGVIVDYFGVFEDLQRALNFDESVIEEAAIDWEKLKEQLPEEVGRCMKFFKGIKIEDTRDCLMACLRRLADEQVGRDFEAQFKRTEVLWEAIAPDECLYPHRRNYAWLCSMYIAHRRRNRRVLATHEELAAKTRQMIQDHTKVLAIAEDLPVYKIDANYLTQVASLPTAADKAAELEAALTAELTEGGGGFLYKMLGERLEQVLARKDAETQVAQRKLRELESLVQEVVGGKTEPERLGLTNPGEWPLFTVIREYAKDKDEALCVKAAKQMMAELQKKRLLPRGWSANAGGRKNVSLALQVASWDTGLMALDLCPTELEDPPFLAAAVEELARAVE
jgi:type I restriction enzyme R subunit